MTSLMASSLRRLRAVWPETGTETGTPGVGQQVQELHVLQQKRISESPLLYAAKENMVQDIKKLIRCPSIDNFQTGTMGETALHIASTYGNYQAVVTLLEAVPELINLPITGELYQGETSLHIAVANGNVGLVRELIRRGADVVTPRATGTFFRLGGTGILYYGEHVLSFAACVGNEEIVRILIENGADIKAQDSLGNTVLHVLVLQQTQLPVACQIYDVLLSSEWPQNEVRPDTILNRDGLSPLKLAAAEGNLQMFEHLVKKQTCGMEPFVRHRTSTYYNLSEIDSWDGDCSVLDLVISSHKTQALKLLQVAPVQQLISLKWDKFGKCYFRLLSCTYLAYIIIFTCCCVFRPLQLRPDNATDDRDTTIYVEKPLRESYQTPGDYVRLVGELISLFGAIAILVIETHDILRYGPKKYFGKSVLGGPFHVINVSMAVLVLLVVLLRLAGVVGQPEPMSLAVVLAWCNLMYFARGFQLLGPFSVMIQKIIFQIILPYLLLMFVVLFAFTCGIYLSFQEDPDKWERFSDFSTTLFNIFMLFFGLVNMPLNGKMQKPDMAQLLYTAYTLLAFALMVFLIIHVMSELIRRLIRERDEIWRGQVAATTLLLERRLPRCLWPRLGICGTPYGLGDSWFLRVGDGKDTECCR
uniref:Transient receptor potential cation channel subfamily V member 6 n=1 Tax=Callorhinchus milii TaxID=7868 RepID=A0A4W3GJU0_CALMI|eukprot:gi/632943532/ref/XP_007886999.1/ PREDICTED: transient receptor potential cation channel subfamily V member 6-like isoform X1 [Callorhinchus milii]